MKGMIITEVLRITARFYSMITGRWSL